MPKRVAIVALGPSGKTYVDVTEGAGGRHVLFDETWVVNTYGDVLACDMVWHMDDVRIQEARARDNPDGKIARMLAWLKTHPGPVMTSRAHPDYPGLIEFPLEDVINSTGGAYFNSTVAYAIAYAIHIGVEQLSIFGVDFTWPNAHEAERGRACCEYWLGRAMQRGMMIHIAQNSTLMDACVPPDQKFYGYDTLDVKMEVEEGRAKVELTPRDEVPSAAEMEARYDHSRRPAIALVK